MANSQRVSILPAQCQPSLDAALDKIRLDWEMGLIPEWGHAPARPGEVLEITIRRVVPAVPAIPFHHQKASGQ